MTNKKNLGSAVKFAMSFLAMIFGLATLKEGGSVAFFDGTARTAAGNYVPFVLWFNFVAGFAYLFAGIQLLRSKPAASKLAVAIAGSTVLVFVALSVWIALGYPFETRTVVAMTLRSIFWVAFAVITNRFRLSPVQR